MEKYQKKIYINLHNTGTLLQPTRNCVELKLLFQITKGQVDNMLVILLVLILSKLNLNIRMT